MTPYALFSSLFGKPGRLTKHHFVIYRQLGVPLILWIAEDSGLADSSVPTEVTEAVNLYKSTIYHNLA